MTRRRRRISVPSSTAVKDELKESLRRQYEELDPVFLLRELEGRQDQFWEHAWGKTAAPPAGEAAERIAATRDRAVGDTSSKRTYRRTRKPSVPHTWRTRVDPFQDVWGQVRILFEIDPSRTVKQLFQDLQARHPGRFPDGQVRTLRRRVKAWRREHLYSEEAVREAFRSNALPAESEMAAAG